MAKMEPSIKRPEIWSRLVDWKVMLPPGCGSSVAFDLFNTSVEKIAEGLRTLGINVWTATREESQQSRRIYIRGINLSDEQLLVVGEVFGFCGIGLERV